MKKELLNLLRLSDDELALLAQNPQDFKELARLELMHRKTLKNTQEAKLELETELGRLYHGDCMSVLDKIQDGSLDCIFADPPFNLKKNYGDKYTDDLTDEDYLRWTRAWTELCIQKLKPGGSFFIFNIPKWAVPTAAILREHLTMRSWVAVDLTLCPPIKGRLYPSHYSLLYFSKGKPSVFNQARVCVETCSNCGKELKDYGGHKKKLNPKGISLKDIWSDISPVRHRVNKNRAANELHPKLIDRILEIATNEGDTVFDPFGGSGTTYAISQIKKRRWIGCEITDCSAIRERLSNPEKDFKIISSLNQTKNRLFSKKALQLREDFGISNKGYPLELDDPPD